MPATEIFIGGYLLPNLIGYRTNMFRSEIRKTRPEKIKNLIGLVFSYPNGKKDTHWISEKEITQKEFSTLPKTIEA